MYNNFVNEILIFFFTSRYPMHDAKFQEETEI